MGLTSYLYKERACSSAENANVFVMRMNRWPKKVTGSARHVMMVHMMSVRYFWSHLETYLIAHVNATRRKRMFPVDRN